MSYPKITSVQVSTKDYEGNFNTPLALEALQNLSFNLVTTELAAGATGETKDDYIFVAPTKLEITSVKFITTAVNTGAGNTPTVSLRDTINEIGNTGIITLGGAVGDVKAMTLDATKVVLAEGAKLIHRIVNPAGTITTTLKGKLQIEWKSVV